MDVNQSCHYDILIKNTIMAKIWLSNSSFEEKHPVIAMDQSELNCFATSMDRNSAPVLLSSICLNSSANSSNLFENG